MHPAPLPPLRYLSRRDIESLGITMAEIVAIVEDVFREKGAGRAQMPPKIDLHPSGDGFIHAMPGFLPARGAAGMKWISGFPVNREHGLPYISGLIVLNDPETGLPVAVMDATWITAMRTEAATAVAAKYLARRDSRSVGIVACGVQGRSNLEALTCVFDLQRVIAFDMRLDAARAFADDASARFGLEGTVAADVRDAVAADIVVTSGPIRRTPSPTIPAGWLAPGAFACPLDFDSYWRGDALAEAHKLATDDVPQMAHFRHLGFFRDTPVPYADLGEIVAGTKPGRESDDEITISMNLGLALEDVAVGVAVLARAKERGVGKELEV
jgi:ornithine cyclodeaminase/alanine dehydrogenase